MLELMGFILARLKTVTRLFLVNDFPNRANTRSRTYESCEANFPENDVQKAVGTVRVLFDPNRNVALKKKNSP